MLTLEDIKKLTTYQIEVFKDVFATKEDFQGLKADFRSLQTSVDGIAVSYKKTGEELSAQTHRTDKMEEWIKPASAKIQVPYSV